MNTLLSHPSFSATEVSSSDIIVATPPPLARTDADTSRGRLIFKKFLEDQHFIERLYERSLLESSGRRAAATVPAEPAVTPTATILRQVVTTLGSAIRASTRAVHQFCRAPVVPYAQFWEANLLVAQVTGRQPPQREELSASDALFVDDMHCSDRWLRN